MPPNEEDLRFEPVSLANGQVTLVRHGAQVLSFRPPSLAQSDRPDVLWCSPTAIHSPSKAIRGGIPVCFPWFGSHPSNPEAPSHGLARTSLWRLVEHEDSSATLECSITHWNLSLMVRVDSAAAALSIELAARNVSPMPQITTHALHTYLRVSDIRKVSVTGLEGKAYIDQLAVADPRKRLQHGKLVFGAETDRIYVNAPDTVCLQDGTRTIAIEKSQAASTVVWNPWIEKSKRLSDMPDDAWTGMVCVEAGNIDEDQRTVPAGDTMTVGTCIRVVSA